MGFDLKYGVVTTERGDIPRDEPVFVLRGKDAACPDALLEYADVAMSVGADAEMCDAIRARAEDIRAWQEAHPERVKVPDTVAGQIRQDGAVGYTDAELKGVPGPLTPPRPEGHRPVG